MPSLLLKNDRFTSNLFKVLPGVSFIIKLEKEPEIIDVSENCESFCGFNKKELLNKDIISFDKLIHQDDLKNVLRHYNANLNSNSISIQEYRIIGKENIFLNVKEYAQINPSYGKYGEVIELYIEQVISNTHAHKLYNAVTSLQKAVNKAELVSITNSKGIITYANELFSNLSGYSIGELIGNNHNIIKSDFHDKSFFKKMWSTILNGKVWRGEICNKSKDGSLYWVDTVISPVFNANGEIESFISIRNDITEKKKLELVVKQSEQKYKQIYSTINDVIYTIDKNGLLSSVSDALERITGWTAKDCVQKPFSNLVHPEDIPISIIAYEKVIKGEKHNPYEIRIKKKNGGYVYAELKPSTLYFNNEIIGTLGVARDISERKESEAKLKFINETLNVKTGKGYFSTLTRYCCKALKVKYVSIAEYDEASDTVRTFSFSTAEKDLGEMECKVKNSPIQRVVNLEGFCFNGNVHELFPDDPIIKKLNIVSFLGYPLLNETSGVIGVISLMHDQPIQNPDECEKLLSYIFLRTANEISREIFERKLIESEAFNKGVLSSMKSQIAVLDHKGNIIMVNKAWSDFACENSGDIALQAGVGYNFFDVCHSAIRKGNKDAEIAFENVNLIINSKKDFFQHEFKCESSTTNRWFLMSVSRLEGENSKVVLRYVDITKSKLVEQKIIDDELKYRTLIENSSEIIFSINKHGDFNFYNDYFLKLLKGKSPQNIKDILASGQYSQIRDIINKSWVYKLKDEINLIIEKKVQSPIFLEGNYTIVNGSNDNWSAMFYLKDVTEIIQAQEKLKSYEKKYKDVVENINDAIVIEDIEGNVQFANNRFSELIGIEADKITNYKRVDYIANGWQEEVKKLYSSLIDNESHNEHFIYEGKRSDGKIIWLEDKPTLLYNDKKVLIGTQSVIRDITKARKSELELKRLVKDLNNRNNEMLQFNYIVSHNLRAPISNIIGLTNLLNNDNISRDEKEMTLKYISNSAQKMDEIIKDLNIVLNTKSNINEKREKTSFKKVIEDILETLNIQISNSSAHIECNIQDGADSLFTIKSYIQSIFYNLISNAIKYRSPERDPIIQIDISINNEDIVIKIVDNGIGIDLEKNNSSLFGLYKRFNEEVEGKGLGLYMTKLQVESLDGRIEIKSKLGSGTTFTIRLKKPFD